MYCSESLLMKLMTLWLMANVSWPLNCGNSSSLAWHKSDHVRPTNWGNPNIWDHFPRFEMIYHLIPQKNEPHN